MEGNPKVSFTEFSGFYKKPLDERKRLVQEFCGFSEEEMGFVTDEGGLSQELANRMTENVIGTMKLPLGVAMNFVINGRPVLIPMCMEEPSVIAAASYAAKLSEGFTTSGDPSHMIGQIQILGVPPDKQGDARDMILAEKDRLLKIMNEQDPVLISFGGGAVDIEPRTIETEVGPMLIVNTVINVGDSMGANAVNTMDESIAKDLERITGGVVKLRIISNLAVRRLARAESVWKKESLGGEEVVNGILGAYYFAKNDPFRAATHNKGIMNGIDAVVHATGNDWRAVEAGAHAYAVYPSGPYRPLTTYRKDENGNLVGSIELPVPVGIVGGCTRTHSTARGAIRMMGVKSASELSQVIAAVGLAQNLAALRALATEGIQKGHMRLARRAAEDASAKK